MKKIIVASVLLMISSFSVAEGIPFTNQAVLDDGTVIVRNGTLYGLETGPTGGTYEVFVVNGRSFKGTEFSTMKCTVHTQLATPMLAKFKNPITLNTVYFEKDGMSNKAIGYLAGVPSLPIDGYTVTVSNKAKDNKWNLLKCTIK